MFSFLIKPQYVKTVACFYSSLPAEAVTIAILKYTRHSTVTVDAGL